MTHNQKKALREILYHDEYIYFLDRVLSYDYVRQYHNESYIKHIAESLSARLFNHELITKSLYDLMTSGDPESRNLGCHMCLKRVYDLIDEL